MRLLILGGTWFLGRVLAELAVAGEHEVTTFNRGQSGPDVAGITPVRGDRTNGADLARLADGQIWDAVVDVNGQVPSAVAGSARALAGHAARYVFVSTVSVYQGWPVEPLTEESPVLPCPPDAGPDFGYEDPRGYPTRYGFLKAGCEAAVAAYFPGERVILRPGVILGPHEYVGRLPWWLRRISAGGNVLAPGEPERAIQPADVRDVARFAITSAAGLSGVFNVTAPVGSATYGGMLQACCRATGSDAELTWVSDDFLLRHQVRQWSEIPLWRVYPGTWKVSSALAAAAGLTSRPITETITATWEWLASGGEMISHQRRAAIGMDPGKERSLLTAWTETRSPTSVRPAGPTRPTIGNEGLM